MSFGVPKKLVNHQFKHVVHDLKPENRVKIDQEEPKLDFLEGNQKVGSADAMAATGNSISDVTKLAKNGRIPKRNTNCGPNVGPNVGQGHSGAYGAIPKYFKQVKKSGNANLTENSNWQK